MAPTTEGAASPPAKRTRKPRSKPAKRYSTDLADAQWALIEPLLPPPATSGRAEKHPRREIVKRGLVPGSGGVRVAAFAQVLPTVGDGLLALGPVEERRHRRPGA